MEFTKIKRTSEGRLEFGWRVPPSPERKDDEREGALRSYDQPLQEFTDAMQALVPHVVKLLELPEKYGESMRVSGVSISYTKEDRKGAVITCLKQVAGANAPLVLNTPYLPEMDLDDPNPSMPTDMLAAIEALEAQAARYVDGEREQRDLFGDEAKDEAAAVATLAQDPEFVGAVAGMAPKAGSGVDTVTISSGGRSVTLTQEDGEHLRKAARRLKLEQSAR